ncbi:unnamed protein product [Amoebophrya sp. A25]|nr:unnamed protein product [Amoebophrya sp. A25]|eukprot:GSA25T00012024001.1
MSPRSPSASPLMGSAGQNSGAAVASASSSEHPKAGSSASLEDTPLTLDGAMRVAKPYLQAPVDVTLEGTTFSLRWWLYTPRPRKDAARLNSTTTNMPDAETPASVTSTSFYGVRTGVLVCLHGFGGSKYEFSALIGSPTPLPEHIGHVIAIDWPFSGGNSHSEADLVLHPHFLQRRGREPATMDDVRFLARLMHTALQEKILPRIKKTLLLNLKLQAKGTNSAGTMDLSQAEKSRDSLRYDLVGHSMGATIALHLADQYPSTLRSLTLVDPALIYPRGKANIVDWVLEGAQTESEFLNNFDGVQNAQFREFILRGNMPGYTYWDAAMQKLASSVGFYRFAKVLKAIMETSSTDSHGANAVAVNGPDSTAEQQAEMNPHPVESKTTEVYLRVQKKWIEEANNGPDYFSQSASFKSPLDLPAPKRGRGPLYIAAGENLRYIQPTIDFLTENSLPWTKVDGAGHFIAVDTPMAFCAQLTDMLS